MDNNSPQPHVCRACDVSWGLIGAVIGTVIILVSADLLTGGALTKFATRGARHLASVTPLRIADDDTA